MEYFSVKLLIFYMENINVLLTRDQLYNHLYGVEWDGKDRKIDIYTSKIRSIVKDLGYKVESVRHKGYIFKKKQTHGG